MDLDGQHLLVTGGAGFIGSHLVERLSATNSVTVVDNLSTGERSWLPDDINIIEGDLTKPSVAQEAITGDIDGVFHLAADKAAERDDIDQFRQNNRLTETVIHRMDEVGIDHLAFTSSSTVYGEAERPTPEDHPLEPISIYGASKAAEEALCSVYAHSHGFHISVFRFANIVGPRLQAGQIIVDFVLKLQDDPERLEILGDGKQEKSYLHVDDCVDAMCHVVTTAEEPLTIVNLGTRSTTTVTTIADIVSSELGLDPEYEFTGGKRGWVGDVPRMQLDIDRLEGFGWTPSASSTEAVRRATKEVVAERLDVSS